MPHPAAIKRAARREAGRQRPLLGPVAAWCSHPTPCPLRVRLRETTHGEPTAPSASVTCSDLSFQWPDRTTIFDGLSVRIGRGRTGLVGANGAGKSTLLRPGIPPRPVIGLPVTVIQ
ncbi:hypothetical protein [Micromonospora deserti]|uniref:hypothetical protein n=1 Tax=Micromonospora deserti TaxID=2070366 RepID=UPI0011B560C8